MEYSKPLVSEMYTEIFCNVPINNQYGIADLCRDYFSIVNTEAEVNSNAGLGTRFKMWNEDKTELFQIFSNRIAYNTIVKAEKSGYIGWKTYFPKAKTLYDLIITKFAELEWNRAGMGYVNKISKIRDDNFELNKYIVCDGENFPRSLANTNKATDLTLGNGNSTLEDNVQLRLRLNIVSPDEYSLMFQKSYISIINHRSNLNEIYMKFEEQHEKSLEFFDNSVTRYVKETIMGGVIND